VSYVLINSTMSNTKR